jgi:hypothetical protein
MGVSPHAAKLAVSALGAIAVAALAGSAVVAALGGSTADAQSRSSPPRRPTSAPSPAAAAVTDGPGMTDGSGDGRGDDADVWQHAVADAKTACAQWQAWGWPVAGKKQWTQRHVQGGAVFSGGSLGDDGTAFFHVYPDQKVAAQPQYAPILLKRNKAGYVEVKWYADGKNVFHQPLSSGSAGGCG